MGGRVQRRERSPIRKCGATHGLRGDPLASARTMPPHSTCRGRVSSVAPAGSRGPEYILNLFASRRRQRGFRSNDAALPGAGGRAGGRIEHGGRGLAVAGFPFPCEGPRPRRSRFRRDAVTRPGARSWLLLPQPSDALDTTRPLAQRADRRSASKHADYCSAHEQASTSRQGMLSSLSKSSTQRRHRSRCWIGLEAEASDRRSKSRSGQSRQVVTSAGSTTGRLAFLAPSSVGAGDRAASAEPACRCSHVGVESVILSGPFLRPLAGCDGARPRHRVRLAVGPLYLRSDRLEGEPGDDPVRQAVADMVYEVVGRDALPACFSDPHL